MISKKPLWFEIIEQNFYVTAINEMFFLKQISGQSEFISSVTSASTPHFR